MQYVNKGLYVTEDGDVQETEYINMLDDSEVCDYNVKMNNEMRKIKYINLANLVAQKKKIDVACDNNKNIKYLYSQHFLGVGVLMCVSDIGGKKKNEIMSKLIGSDVYGNAYVGLLDNNASMPNIIDLTQKLFDKLINTTVYLDNTFQAKNKVFCNIYAEL